MTLDGVSLAKSNDGAVESVEQDQTAYISLSKTYSITNPEQHIRYTYTIDMLLSAKEPNNII